MSDSHRPKRTTTKPPLNTETADPKAVREEFTRMLHSETPDLRPPPSVLRPSWDLLDDLPEQRRRGPMPPQRPQPPAPAAPPAQKQTAAFRQPESAPRQRPQPPRPARDILDEPPVAPRTRSIAESRAALPRPESLGIPRWASSVPEPPLYAEMNRKPWKMLAVACISAAIIIMYLMPPQISMNGRNPSADTGGNVVAVASSNVPTGEHSIVRTPTISASKIDSVLRDYGSPAEGTGNDWVDLGKKYNIDPAYALAFFVVESTAGTAQGWAGWKDDGSSTHNIGNIICAGYATCYGRFRDYGSWQEGIEDWYRLISVEYVNGRGLQTVEQIIPIYAPSFENDVDNYVNSVEKLVEAWRS